jgi:hypothetical protein
MSNGRLALSAATNRLGLGDKVRLIPGHCDPTLNLYDWYASAPIASSKSGRSPSAAPYIDVETEYPGSDDDPRRDVMPRDQVVHA